MSEDDLESKLDKAKQKVQDGVNYVIEKIEDGLMMTELLIEEKSRDLYMRYVPRWKKYKAKKKEQFKQKYMKR